jgi:hypothetical protein
MNLFRIHFENIREQANHSWERCCGFKDPPPLQTQERRIPFA